MDETIHKLFSFTGLEIFTIGTTIVSLFYNLWQFLEARKNKSEVFKPISNNLIAIFNNIKTGQNTAYYLKQNLNDKTNPHKDLETLRYEYTNYLQNNMNYLDGVKELLVGALISINPNDKTGENVFKASDYGLTEEDRQRKKEFMKNWKPNNS
jgi:hypothetical protein